MQLSRSRIRLVCDARVKDQVADVFTGASPDLWNSNDAQLEIGIHDADVLVDNISNIESLTVSINQLADRKTAVVAPITIAAIDLDGTVTAETWADGTKQHALIPLTSEQLNFDLAGQTSQSYWLVVSVVTTDVPAQTFTVGASVLRVLEDGTPPDGAPDPGDPLYFDAGQSDARYLQLGSLHHASLRKTGAAQSAPSGAFTRVTFAFANIEYDSGNYFDDATDKLTPGGGPVTIRAVVGLDSSPGSGRHLLSIYKNGVIWREIDDAQPADLNILSGTVTDVATGADYYQLYVWTNEIGVTVQSALFQIDQIP